MISHARRGAGALAAGAAIVTSCAACALLPPRQPGPGRPRPAATSACPAPASPAAGPAALLPLGPAQLQAAAALAARFAAAYDTHRPGEPPSVWLARLAPMATSQLTGALTRAAATPAAGSPGAVPAGTGRVVAGQIRGLTPTSVIFTVRVRQVITTATGHRTATDALAVTVTGHGGGWAAYDIEPAAAGDTGGASAAAGQ